MTTKKFLDAYTGYELVDSEVICIFTRFKVRTMMGLVRAYFWYRRVRRQASVVDGLIATAFLVENTRTFYTYSIWKSARAIVDFNGKVLEHVNAANASFLDLERLRKKPHLWSAQFRLDAVSLHNLCWEGVDVGQYYSMQRVTDDD